MAESNFGLSRIIITKASTMLGTSTKREGKHLSKSDGSKSIVVPNEIELEKVEKSPDPVSSPTTSKPEETGVDESTDSENDPAAAGHHTAFRRKLSTNKQIKTTVRRNEIDMLGTRSVWSQYFCQLCASDLFDPIY